MSTSSCSCSATANTIPSSNKSSSPSMMMNSGLDFQQSSEQAKQTMESNPQGESTTPSVMIKNEERGLQEEDHDLLPPPRAWYDQEAAAAGLSAMEHSAAACCSKYDDDDIDVGDDVNEFPFAQQETPERETQAFGCILQQEQHQQQGESTTALVFHSTTSFPQQQQVAATQSTTTMMMNDTTTSSIRNAPPHRQYSSSSIPAPLASPGWKELSTKVFPTAAKELFANSLLRLCHSARRNYVRGRYWHVQYSGQAMAGYVRTSPELPLFSTLSWTDRQLVEEWRSIVNQNEEEENDDFDFAKARTLVPALLPRPVWHHAAFCFACRLPFGPTCLRHHCRRCGRSFCQRHSCCTHFMPQYGYVVPERVCQNCKTTLTNQALAERIAWRLARVRDLMNTSLTPYFERGVDTVEQAALRLARGALAMAKAIPLGAQATVAVETLDVLRKYGLHGIYGILLRREFLAAAELLRHALGISKTTRPLSVHELSAAIFYALAQHRAVRGMCPEREYLYHGMRQENNNHETNSAIVDDTDEYDPNENAAMLRMPQEEEEAIPSLPFAPVCDPVPDEVLSSLLFYAPMALNFIYASKEVDMQLLAAQQGWRLLYAYIDHHQSNNDLLVQDDIDDLPASALFVHETFKIACLSVRGTSTIHDVITDIRQTPVTFPQDEEDDEDDDAGDWMAIGGGNNNNNNSDSQQGLAVCGMATAAINLFKEHVDALMALAESGYRIRITGHSLGGGVATLLGILLQQHLQQQQSTHDLLRVYAYGTPSCVDAKLSEYVQSFVTTVVLHDDVIPRLTPTSCRGLLKHLLHIRETWVKTHLTRDLMAITQRAKTAWAPRWRQSFLLQQNAVTSASGTSTQSWKRYCQVQYQKGKQLLTNTTSTNNKQQQSRGKIVSHDQVVIHKSYTPQEMDQHVTTTSSNYTTTQQQTTNNQQQQPDNNNEQDPNQQQQETTKKQVKRVVEIMGGCDHRNTAVLIDGEEFFDTSASLLEKEDDDDDYKSAYQGTTSSPLKRTNDLGASDDSGLGSPKNEDRVDHNSSSGSSSTDSWGMAVTGLEPASRATREEHNDNTAIDEDDGPAPVVLEETPLPRMFIPGKIVHIYSHRGVYKAAYVPRAYRELRRISMAGNMLSDHSTKSYYEALQEVQSVRAATESPPRWTAFDEDDTCSCCASRFTWASTSDSEAQEARDKHNCRSCGGLVCHPCSENRVPLPSIGVTTPVRVCDRCYNDMNSLFSEGCHGGSRPRTRSFRDLDDSVVVTTTLDGINFSLLEEEEATTSQEPPERQRERRSLIVDELASRIRSKALPCS